MCGIAGWVGVDSAAPHVADQVAHALRHRGPDAMGIKRWNNATLVHTRLSIIDLSFTGGQPMSNEDSTVWTVFNGEIYNHRELRNELSSLGHIFRGCSDTEVLPHLYEELGAAMAEKLRGMFALAIYDTRRRKLLLIRDRFGIKPLFYASVPGRFMFASELRALRQMPGIDETPDRQAISDFAALFYVPAPQTFFRGIQALCPGELLQVEEQGEELEIRKRRYHQWNLEADESLTLERATERAEALIERAVGRQLQSDVPLGALLSGGIDSSLVTWAAQKANGGVQSFNVRFSDTEFDESWAAVETARHFGSIHKTLEMDDFPGTWDRITSILRQAGQPFADTSVFAASAMCEFVRQHVTVALSGDGGDEGFGGYDSFWRIGAIARWQSVPKRLRSAATSVFAPALSKLYLLPSRYCQRLIRLGQADNTEILEDLDSWIREKEHAELCGNEELLPVSRWFEPQWSHGSAAKRSRLAELSAHATEVKMRLRLPNDYLFKVDLASMRTSLEMRVPMLDEELVQFGLTLPHRLKVQGRTCKQVLRNVARRHVPARVASKRKAGFRVPIDRWVTREFKANVRDFLLGIDSPVQAYCCRKSYEPWVAAFWEGKQHPAISRGGLYERVIMLLSLGLALRRH